MSRDSVDVGDMDPDYDKSLDANFDSTRSALHSTMSLPRDDEAASERFPKSPRMSLILARKRNEMKLARLKQSFTEYRKVFGEDAALKTLATIASREFSDTQKQDLLFFMSSASSSAGETDQPQTSPKQQPSSQSHPASSADLTTSVPKSRSRYFAYRQSLASKGTSQQQKQEPLQQLLVLSPPAGKLAQIERRLSLPNTTVGLEARLRRQEALNALSSFISNDSTCASNERCSSTDKYFPKVPIKDYSPQFKEIKSLSSIGCDNKVSTPGIDQIQNFKLSNQQRQMHCDVSSDSQQVLSGNTLANSRDESLDNYDEIILPMGTTSLFDFQRMRGDETAKFIFLASNSISSTEASTDALTGTSTLQTLSTHGSQSQFTLHSSSLSAHRQRAATVTHSQTIAHYSTKNGLMPSSRTPDVSRSDRRIISMQNYYKALSQRLDLESINTTEVLDKMEANAVEYVRRQKARFTRRHSVDSTRIEFNPEYVYTGVVETAVGIISHLNEAQQMSDIRNHRDNHNFLPSGSMTPLPFIDPNFLEEYQLSLQRRKRHNLFKEKTYREAFNPMILHRNRDLPNIIALPSFQQQTIEAAFWT